MDTSAFTAQRCLALVVGVAILVAACGPGGSAPSDASSTDPAATGPAETPSSVPTSASTSAPTPAPPVVRAGEPWITFQWIRSKSEVALIRPDGSGAHSPTTLVPGGDQTNPDWSPDGARLVFGVTIDNRDDLWVVDADGTDPMVLVDCEAPCLWLDDPAWSPDGRSLIFSRMAMVGGAGVGTLEVLDLASGTVDVVVTAAPGDFYAGQRWSPDGRSVVLEVVHRVDSDPFADAEDVTLAIIDIANPTPTGRALTAPGVFPETATWSPDGRSIMFAALEHPGDEHTDLYVVSVDGTGLRRITMLAAEGGSASHPDVSVDGLRIVFVATIPGKGSNLLASVAMDGGDIAPATGGTTYIPGFHPRFRPLP